MSSISGQLVCIYLPLSIQAPPIKSGSVISFPTSLCSSSPLKVKFQCDVCIVSLPLMWWLYSNEVNIVLLVK